MAVVRRRAGCRRAAMMALRLRVHRAIDGTLPGTRPHGYLSPLHAQQCERHNEQACDALAGAVAGRHEILGYQPGFVLYTHATEGRRRRLWIDAAEVGRVAVRGAVV